MWLVTTKRELLIKEIDVSERTVEEERLEEEAARRQNWKRWGPYLPERQWGTVREDYSAEQDPWAYFPHDHARSRAYRWGEDGLLGWTDRQCRLCVAPSFWNERDPILKERLFGLSHSEGNHGEDVKEVYYYLDSLPTHAYAKALYRYPQEAFPYRRLVAENARRSRHDRELELIDTGVFDQDRYFDCWIEYAKGGPNDILIRITVSNRGPEKAPIHLLPTLWARNTWIWGCSHEGCGLKPAVSQESPSTLNIHHEGLEPFTLEIGPYSDGSFPEWLFTENETNTQKLFGSPSWTDYVKDAFHERVVQGAERAVNPEGRGTKAAPWYRFDLAPGESATVKLRLFGESERPPEADRVGEAFDEIFRRRIEETDAFYEKVLPANLADRQRLLLRQAYAGLLWTKQFYHYIIEDWLDGDANMPQPPSSRREGRNSDWSQLYCRDLLSMPDKWEYPWFAAWDHAFHMIPFARIDPEFTKQSLIRLLREWYMHPNGQIPAHEFNFSDVNPPVDAYACWRVYQRTAQAGKADTSFLESCFQKLLLNFTWWVNRKDPFGRHLFSGGFLGLDNISVFDRNKPLASGHYLTQADATAWMGFYCGTMLAIALELAPQNRAYEDMASKFFEHFVGIVDSVNTLGGSGLWDEADGFYYDQLSVGDDVIPLRVRSLVGLIPLIAVEVINRSHMRQLPGFCKRLNWFMENRADLARHIAFMECSEENENGLYLLAIPSRSKLLRVLSYLLDPEEFLSPFGIRSLSKFHERHPFGIHLEGEYHEVRYEPGESQTGLFGGNSNWRGPIWMPLNYLLIEALERYHDFFGDSLQVECPTRSGEYKNLREVAREIEGRLLRLFEPASSEGGTSTMSWGNERNEALHLFYEFFHAETGQGLGASHQTGWTALIAPMLEDYVAGDSG